MRLFIPCPFCHRRILSLFYKRHRARHMERRPDGQMRDHAKLPTSERFSGSLAGVPCSYRHPKCGVVTTVSEDIMRTWLANPFFYNGRSFCCGCKDYVNPRELYWVKTNECVFQFTQRLQQDYLRINGGPPNALPPNSAGNPGSKKIDKSPSRQLVGRKLKHLVALREAAERIKLGHCVALKESTTGIVADVVDLTAQEAVQIDDVVGKDEAAAVQDILGAAEQLRKNSPTIPADYSHVIDVRINSTNSLYKLGRKAISAALAPRITRVALQGVDRIRIHNGIEFLDFTPSELSQ